MNNIANAEGGFAMLSLYMSNLFTNCEVTVIIRKH